MTATAIELDKGLDPTVGTLKNGAPAHRLTPEDRRLAVEKRRQKAEAAKAAKLETLLPKAWKMFEKALSQVDVDARALDAAKFVWEQEHGKATQRIETTETASSPFDALSEADKELAIQAARQRLRALEGGKAASG